MKETNIRTIAEYAAIKELLLRFPKGIISIVCDTFDLWKVCTEILPRLKKEILAREGKLVIRPDSGDPVDIVCGTIKDNTYFDEMGEYSTKEEYYERVKGTAEYNVSKGVTELLWDTFGGTISDEGYKVLDSHVGVIYGDSITYPRAKEIFERLSNKEFASTNVVMGVGSFSLQYVTRDTHGFAFKATYIELKDEEGNLECINLLKDPITDSGIKKSIEGLPYVTKEKGNYEVEDKVTWEKFISEGNELKLLYRNGEFVRRTTLTEIRKKLGLV